jgi:MerR family copper efflux transcriptional regulator
MLIGQLSRLTGFSKDTIRYYEKIELIVLPGRPRLSKHYKDYPDDLVHVLNAIRKYKDLGFTLEEIRELLVLQSIQSLDVPKLLDRVKIKTIGIEAEIEKLHQFRLKLNIERERLMQQKTGRILTLPEMKLAA